MSHFSIEPEVSGELGENTIMDHSVIPPKVLSLDFIFKVWLGDDIVECYPIFLVSERLKGYLEASAFSGFSIENCKIEVSDDFFMLQPHVQLPPFFWLKISGNQESDFFVDDKKLLTISERVLLDLKGKFNISNAIINKVSSD